MKRVRPYPVAPEWLLERSQVEALLKRQESIDSMLKKVQASIEALAVEERRTDVTTLFRQWEQRLERLQTRKEDLRLKKYMNFALMSLRDGNFERTRTVLERLLRVSEMRGSLQFSSYVCLGLGELFFVNNNARRAENCYQRAFEGFRKVNDSKAAAATAANLAELYCDLHDIKKCNEFSKEAVKILIWETIEPDQMLLRSYAQLARLNLERGDIELAEEMLKRLVKVVRGV